MGTDDSPGVPFTGKSQLGGQLPRPLDGSLLLEADLSGLTDTFSRQKLPKDRIPRPSYQDPKSLLPRPCGSRILIVMEGILRKFVDEWMGTT